MVLINSSNANWFHSHPSPELVIHHYPVPPKAVSELTELFPTHDVCIMHIITMDGKDDHHPAEFERILCDALVTISSQILTPKHVQCLYRLNTRMKSNSWALCYISHWMSPTFISTTQWGGATPFKICTFPRWLPRRNHVRGRLNTQKCATSSPNCEALKNKEKS